MSTTSEIPGDLKSLKREVAEMAESRKRARSTEEKDARRLAESETAAKAGSEDYDISDQLEIYLKEIEETARERPALTLLATFAIGIIVGHLFSRR